VTVDKVSNVKVQVMSLYPECIVVLNPLYLRSIPYVHSLCCTFPFSIAIIIPASVNVVFSRCQSGCNIH